MHGRSRAQRLYEAKSCEMCGALDAERHHRDHNTLNNESSNIIFVCRRCHMMEDGRLNRFRETAATYRLEATVARYRQIGVVPGRIADIAKDYGVSRGTVDRARAYLRSGKLQGSFQVLLADC